jgi:hypothetical protein
VRTRVRIGVRSDVRSGLYGMRNARTRGAWLDFVESDLDCIPARRSCMPIDGGREGIYVCTCAFTLSISLE